MLVTTEDLSPASHSLITTQVVITVGVEKYDGKNMLT